MVLFLFPDVNHDIPGKSFQLTYLYRLLVYLKKMTFLKKFFILILVVTLSVTVAYPQTVASEDSLREQISKTTGADQYHNLVALLRLKAEYDNVTALELAEDAFQIASDLKDSTLIVQSGRIRGLLLNRLERFTDAIAILNSVYSTAEKRNLRNDFKLILDNLAIAYTFHAEYEKALQMNFTSLVLKEEDKDTLAISFALNNIGLTYFRMENFNEALAYYLKAIRLRESTGDQYDMSTTMSNAGITYYGLDNLPEAKKYFLRALEICGAHCTPSELGQAHLGLGKIYWDLKQYDASEYHLRLSVQFARDMPGLRTYAESLILLSKIDNVMGRSNQAEAKLREALSIAKREQIRSLIVGIYSNLALVFEKRKEPDSANLYLHKYIAIKDTINNENQLKKLSKIRSDYEQRENLATIKAREMTIDQQKLVNLYTTATAVLCVLLIFVLLYTNHVTRKVNSQLSTAQNIIVEQNKLLELKNRDLDNKVEKKTEELKLVNLSLKEMNTEVDSFIMKTSQDIQGPLASLKGICNVAMLDIQDEASRVYLDKINKTTESLNSILRRLLVINRISNTRPVYKQIDFRSVMQEVMIKQQAKGLPANLTIRKNIQEAAILFSDPELLAMVLENSLENVMKYCRTSPESEYFFEVNVEESGHGRVNIRVVDNGQNPSHRSQNRFGFIMGNQQSGDEHDQYFVKTAVAKIGGKVDLRKTAEGYNEMTLILSHDPIRNLR